MPSDPSVQSESSENQREQKAMSDKLTDVGQKDSVEDEGNRALARLPEGAEIRWSMTNIGDGWTVTLQEFTHFKGATADEAVDAALAARESAALPNRDDEIERLRTELGLVQRALNALQGFEGHEINEAYEALREDIDRMSPEFAAERSSWMRKLMAERAMLRASWDKLEQRADAAKDALVALADAHHRTITGSRLHDPEHIEDFRDCPAKSCQKARTALDATPTSGRVPASRPPSDEEPPR